MAYNFRACDRDQAFLLPPDVRDWLPADHLAWFVLDVVDQLDLGPFLKAYRADGHGRAAYEPRMLLAVLLYGYCTGVRSSRQIERRCTEDIAFRVLAGNSTPDHVTIARFRVRHEQALAGLLIQSLKLCAAAGMVRLGLIALDGTKVEANAAAAANRTHAHLQAHGNGRTLQGYNAQAAATCEQVVVAAELTQQANDLQQLAPMLGAIRTTLTAAGIDDPVQRLAADSGYWSIANLSAIPGAPELLIPPARHGRHGKPRKDGKPSASKSDKLRAAMLARLDSAQGKACYAQRSRTIEPVFGQVKTIQGGRRFMRRGLAACQAEWKLLCGTHNLLKLWRTTTATTS